MSEKKQVTVLGIGNILMGDEGFGAHFVRWLSRRYRETDDFRMVDGGTLGYKLLDIICGCDHLIVVDVLKLDDTPGSIYRFSKKEMEYVNHWKDENILESFFISVSKKEAVLILQNIDESKTKELIESLPYYPYMERIAYYNLKKQF